MARTKLRWDFPPQAEMHTIAVKDINNHGLNNYITYLRPCRFGYNEQDEVVRILYCTRDVRFFTHYADGWREQPPCTNRVRRGKSNKNAKAGGGFDTPYMNQQFGDLSCHRAIAYAWCEWPEESKTDPEWYKLGHGFEVDHLNGDHSDSNPENLRWVTPAENRKWDKRCGREQYKDGAHKGKTLRGIALDPKRITYNNLRRIANLSDHQFETFLIEVQERMELDPSPLSVESINRDIAVALDVIVYFTDHCIRCNREIITVYDELKCTSDGDILCDCCYDELYG